jgi:hypothetical protein
MADPRQLQVGFVVRAPLPNHPNALGRALVLTEPDEQDDTVCLLWEPTAPKPISLPSSSTTKLFLITPLLRPPKNIEQEETTISSQVVKPLLPFEDSCIADDESLTVAEWKDRGDELLRLGDASAAASYYEMALSKSSTLQIGSTIITKMGGYPKLAEVDCLEDDSLDVTLVESGEETITHSQILLCLLEPDTEKCQERILLNLARCLLQLADLDHPTSESRPKYLKAAVLACTLALTVISFVNDDEKEIPANSQTAWILRAKAQAALAKWPHALSDAKKVVKAGHKQGRKLLDDIERQQRQKVKTDKKLAKEVCKWVETATSDSVSDDQVAPKEDTNDAITPKETTTNAPSFSIPSWLQFVILPLMAALLIQKLLASNQASQQHQ